MAKPEPIISGDRVTHEPTGREGVAMTNSYTDTPDPRVQVGWLDGAEPSHVPHNQLSPRDK